MNKLNIGVRIAELRNESNITQLELAEKLGVTDRAVSKWETGGSYPDVSLLPNIADIFNVSIDYLLRGKSILKQEFYVDYANYKFNKVVNENYLSKGWKIIDMKLSGDKDDVFMCAVVVQKEMYTD